ncbi:hypothetical protein B0T21DRAFT_322608 [Apiosordaria backusii]|uniref:Uncharacterized protein n=1 Tax=Apiosordaria backusii TaxID=314023 RepID=A0AA40EXZ3_9PEZI|nr:hypothetical protein B0T21DRAFT_322608 [Apiosordaria backusii]
MTQLTPEEEAASARAAHQAALRKAKREAKIRAGAESRLNKITGLGGGVQRDPPAGAAPSSIVNDTSSPSPSPAASAAAAVPTPTPAPHHTDDPEEVDISASEHFYRPAATQRIPPDPLNGTGLDMNMGDINEQALRQMMLGFDGPAPGTVGGGGGGGGDPMQEDPMMAMMMQMLGAGGGGSPGSAPPNPFAGFPGMGGFPGMSSPQDQPQQSQPPSKIPTLFKLLHTLIALSLGLYLLLSTPFTGSKLDRDRSILAESGSALFQSPQEQQAKKNFVWAFATAEILLFTTRFLVDSQTGGRSGEQTGGVLGGLINFLPQPLKGRVEMGVRYARVVGRVREDVLLVVFVLGVGHWIRG